ncbi:MAG: S53 family peptidase [Nocardioides sp.]|uniref:S53 family peptidase n=1 Tax=Nocardioides sp. TaxID=35761 RepID=UPI0039E2293C
MRSLALIAAGALLPLTAAVPAHAVPASAVASGDDIDFVVQLATRDRAGLHALAREVNDPASPSYHHYLTQAEYQQRFAPTSATVTATRTVLASLGITVDGATANGSYLAVHAPAGVAASVFRTSFTLADVGGLSLRKTLTDPVIPAALSGLVSNVAGLSQSAPLVPAHRTDTDTDATGGAGGVDADASAVFLNARPCGSYYGQLTATDAPAYNGASQKYSVCGYEGRQLRKAYGLEQTGLTGKGVSVGIVDAYASDTILEDANTYATSHGEQPFADGQFVENVPVGVQQIPEDPTGIGLIDPDGWAGEETLDVEAVHSMAPDATIVYQTGVTPYGPFLYLAIGALVEGGQVQVISNSFGTSSDSPLPSDQALLDQITDQAAATGITIAFSSGDDGDETEGGADRTADYPATSPGVVAVGGTTLAIGADGQRQFESYWGTRKYLRNADNQSWNLGSYTYGGAGGGGVSSTYAEPDWQKGVVPDSLTTYDGVTSTPGRVLPDLSLLGDPTTGMLVGQTQTFPDGTDRYSEYRIGGTSLASPLFAGLMALAVQHHGSGLGLPTPTLYAASKDAGNRASLFYDPVGVATANGTSLLANVRSDYTDTSDSTSAVIPSLRTLGNLATLSRLDGYDDSTGLGVPRAAALIAVLNGEPIPAAASTSTSAPGATSSPVSASGRIQILKVAVRRLHGGRWRIAVRVRNRATTPVAAFPVSVKRGKRALAARTAPALAAGSSERVVLRVKSGAKRVRVLAGGAAKSVALRR